MENNEVNVVNNQAEQTINETVPKKSNKIIFIIIGIVVGFFILIIGLVVLFLVVFAKSSNNLKCTSKEGNITIFYNDKTITGYTATGITYDFDEQKIVSQKLGIDKYIFEFDKWFKSNTTGICINTKK